MRAIFVVLLVALLATSAYSASSNSNKDTKKSDSPSKSSTPSRSAPPPYKQKEELCRSHIVQPGDTALSVSEAYKVDYDQMVAALEQCIGYTEGSFLTVGQSICLPPYYPSCKFVTATDPTADECKVYTVQQGDTMASIASSFNLYMHWMVALNGEAVQPGQRIKLPPWYSRCPSMEAATNPPCRVYSVKTGDSMYRIAAGFRTSVDELIAANPGFTANSVLSQGQPVKIPPFPATCGAGTPVSGYPTDGVTSCRAYRVEPGDSVYSIAMAFATSGADIVAINPELNDPSRLSPGNAIKIPPWDDSCSEEGVLIDPSAANNTPTGTGALVPGTGTLVPNPASSPVPVAPVAAIPPRQVATGTPAHAPALAPGLAPGPSTTAPGNATSAVVNQMKSKVEMLISGVSNTEFAVKQQAVVSAIATAANVPTTSVSITFVLPATSPSAGRRMLLLSSSAVKVQSLVTGDPVAVQNNLMAAQRAGTLSAAFTVEGMTLDSMTMIDPLGKSTPIVASTSTPATGGTPSTNSGSSLPLPMGALIGIAAGVVCLIAALTAIGCCVSKRRKRREAEAAAARLAAAAASKRYAGVNAYVTTSSLRSKYSSDELKDYNGGGGNNGSKTKRSGSAGASPNRSPRRGPGSHRSSTRGGSRNNLNDAYVISTTVSNTPKAGDDGRAEEHSRPPSSATSAADTLVDEYQPMYAPAHVVQQPVVPVVVMPPPQEQQQQQQQQYHQQRQQIVMEAVGSSSPKESVAEVSSSPYDKVEEEYEEEQYYLAAAPAPLVGRSIAAVETAPMFVRPLPSVRDGSFKRNPVPRAAAQAGEFSVAAVQSKSFRNSADFTAPPPSAAAAAAAAGGKFSTSSPRRDLSSPTGKRSGGYVSPYSQKVVSGQVSMPRSPSRTSAGGGAGRVAAKMTTTSTVDVGAGSSPTKANGGYASPYSQQKLRSPQRSPQRSPTRKAAHERLTAYAEM